MREIVNEYGSFIIEAIILSVFIKGASFVNMLTVIYND